MTKLPRYYLTRRGYHILAGDWVTRASAAEELRRLGSFRVYPSDRRTMLLCFLSGTRGVSLKKLFSAGVGPETVDMLVRDRLIHRGPQV